MKAPLCIMLCAIFVLFAPGQNLKADREPVVQKYRGPGSGWESPRPGPDETEIRKWIGSFRILISDEGALWGGKLLTIKTIQEVPVKDVYPRLETGASISVPLSWDDQKPVGIAVSFRLTYDAATKKTRIVGIRMELQMNLSYRDGLQKYVFEGSYIDELKGFAGTYSENGSLKGYFVAIKK